MNIADRMIVNSMKSGTAIADLSARNAFRVIAVA
jgi:hypothetical protein